MPGVGSLGHTDLQTDTREWFPFRFAVAAASVPATLKGASFSSQVAVYDVTQKTKTKKKKKT